MSGITTLVEFMEKNMLPKYDPECQVFTPEIQEEYLTEAGWIDRDYICGKLKVSLSMDSFRKAVKQVFGVAQFVQIPQFSNMTQREFNKIYEFGKFNNMRSWIGYAYATTGKIICRNDVYDYVLGS